MQVKKCIMTCEGTLLVDAVCLHCITVTANVLHTTEVSEIDKASVL